MYNTQPNVQYGWQSNPRNSDMIELPMTPVRRPRTTGGDCCYGGINWHTFGILLSLIAAASLALGVADVVVTYKTYMEGLNCLTYTTPSYCDPNNLVFTWVAVGIWGSLPVFIFGVFAICKGSRPMQPIGHFDLLAFICTFIFTPAIIVLSAVEVYKGRNIYYWTAANLQTDDLVKAIIPIVISGLGLVEFIMCFTAFLSVCCNSSSAGHMYGGSMDKPVLRTAQQYPQGTYDRPYTAQPTNQVCRTSCGGQASTFYAAQAPPRVTSTYNQYNTGPMGCSGFKQCSPNPAYNYFRS